MFLKFFDPNVNFAKAVLITASVMILIFLYLARKYSFGKKLEKNLSIALVLVAALSFWSYFNFGFYHYKGGFFHGFHMYHQYMGSKYFKELGYDYLYDATIIADSESQGFLKNVEKIKGSK